jgi:ATP-dependent RNA helicase RhlE
LPRRTTPPHPDPGQAIPPLLTGRDLLGIAQTGTGKTAAFALPLLQRLGGTGTKARPGHPRALILSPPANWPADRRQRELMRTYGRIRLRGGVRRRPIRRQIDKLRRGVDVVVATPGRLLDLLNQGHLRLDAVEVFVLDEADRMLDMGFIHDIKRVARLLPNGGRTCCSPRPCPTPSRSRRKPAARARSRRRGARATPTAETVEQRVLFVDGPTRNPQRSPSVDRGQRWYRVLVFTRTKHGANRIARSS